jgi:hypothetical protein
VQYCRYNRQTSKSVSEPNVPWPGKFDKGRVWNTSTFSSVPTTSWWWLGGLYISLLSRSAWRRNTWCYRRHEISSQMISLVEQQVITALMAGMMASLNIDLDVHGIVSERHSKYVAIASRGRRRREVRIFVCWSWWWHGAFIIDEERINSDVPMLLTRMAEEISCRARDSNSTAENDHLDLDLYISTRG